MKRFMTLVGMVCAMASQAQTYDYTFTTSSMSYQALTGGTEIWSGHAWDAEEALINLGFDFSYGGQTYQQVTIHSDGMLSFDAHFERSVVGFGSDLACKAVNGAPVSKVRHTLSGSAGNRIFKLEYAQAGLYGGSGNDEANFQIWLHEASGVIEFHYGNCVASDPEEAFEDETGPTIGLLNMVETTGTSGLLVSGNSGSETTTNVIGESRDYLNGVPLNGTTYRFTPN